MESNAVSHILNAASVVQAFALLPMLKNQSDLDSGASLKGKITKF